jgi:hypothetical protein
MSLDYLEWNMSDSTYLRMHSADCKVMTDLERHVASHLHHHRGGLLYNMH